MTDGAADRIRNTCQLELLLALFKRTTNQRGHHGEEKNRKSKRASRGSKRPCFTLSGALSTERRVRMCLPESSERLTVDTPVQIAWLTEYDDFHDPVIIFELPWLTLAGDTDPTMKRSAEDRAAEHTPQEKLVLLRMLFELIREALIYERGSVWFEKTELRVVRDAERLKLSPHQGRLNLLNDFISQPASLTVVDWKARQGRS